MLRNGKQRIGIRRETDSALYAGGGDGSGDLLLEEGVNDDAWKHHDGQGREHAGVVVGEGLIKVGQGNGQRTVGLGGGQQRGIVVLVPVPQEHQDPGGSQPVAGQGKINLPEGPEESAAVDGGGFVQIHGDGREIGLQHEKTHGDAAGQIHQPKSRAGIVQAHVHDHLENGLCLGVPGHQQG